MVRAKEALYQKIYIAGDATTRLTHLDDPAMQLFVMLGISSLLRQQFDPLVHISPHTVAFVDVFIEILMNADPAEIVGLPPAS